MKISLPYLSSFIILFPSILLAQTEYNSESQTTSYKDLKDTSALKREISQFTEAGAKNNFLIHEDELLIEIPTLNCTDTTIDFEKGNWISMNLYVYIEISSELKKNYIKTFKMYYTDHHEIKIPESAYSDIYQPHTCDIPVTKINKVIQSSTCKVFKHPDRKRVYIYMIIGDKENEQEVTWVIQNAKYLMRIIDKIE